MHARAAADLAAEGFSAERIHVTRFADLRYRRQISELMLPLPDSEIRAATLAELVEGFHREHERTYGYAIREERVELVAFKLRARGQRADALEVPWRHLADTRTVRRTDRSVYFGAGVGHVRTAVIGRADLGEAPSAGPFIIEEYDSTVVVPPGWCAQRSSIGFLILEVST
jgi:N-methylhydantoinase A